MFGTDHAKLSQKELQNGLHNAQLLNQQALVAFFKRQEDMDRIYEKGPVLHADAQLVRECVNFVMRAMIANDLENRLKHKTNKNN